ncbi:Trm112 family protein [bacterium]|nr:Trm112 family protein [bacterium]
MALDQFLVSVLQDPTDHDVLYYVESAQVLYNPRRKVAYAINGAIPVLLPDEAREVSEAEHAQFTADGAYVVTGSK